MFSSEAELVEFSLPLLIEEFKKEGIIVRYVEEPKGLFGVPDVIIFNGRVVSVEYKLKNWKQAIKQAYRYKSFSYETYVVLDMEYAESAKRNLELFTKFNIGLGAVGNDGIEFFYKPDSKKPFNNSLSEKAIELLKDNCK